MRRARASRRGSKHSPSVIVVIGAALLLPMALPKAAGAASPSASTSRAAGDPRALTLYRESTTAYEQGRFQEAVNLLLEAYALQPEPVILFNLARAYEGLGDLQKAIESYGRYLDRDPGASDRKSIEQRIATLKKQVDDLAALEKQRDEERARAIEAGRAAADAERRAELEEQRKRRPSAVPWVVAGVGVLGVGVGLVLGVVSHEHYESAVNEPFKSPAEADYGAARNFASGANAAFVAGGVIAVAGASWGLISLFTGTRAPAHPAAEAVVSPRFVGLTGRF